ncbi:MAG: DUF1996 domain-containing protein [Pseudomonadota bacterium]
MNFTVFALSAAIVSLAYATCGVANERGIVRSWAEVGAREDGSGAFRTHCLESNISHDDPLVWPGRVNATHEHVFFGNPTVDAYTTVKNLLNTDISTCDGLGLNKSAYWVPSLYGANGTRIKYVDPLFYYKTGYHIPAKLITVPPHGLRIIAGDAHAQSPQGLHIARFRCESWQSDRIWFSPGDPLDHVNYLPACQIGDLLEIRLTFPQCWDGQNLTSADHKSHMAYPVEARPPYTGTGSCPKSHPIPIPEISYNFGIRVTAETGPSNLWRFSSDMGETIVGGASLHGDWMNGWNTQIMERIVHNCLNTGTECMVGLLGDGTRLQPIPLD